MLTRQRRRLDVGQLHLYRMLPLRAPPLLLAAEDLIRKGHQPTVSEAAEAAGISRATAYRYFPRQELMWAEVALFSLFTPEASDLPVPEAVGDLVRRVAAWTFDNEQPFRTLLRLSLDPSSGVRRPGHRMAWISDVLAPAKGEMDAQTYRRLSNALALMLGIDPIVVMRDIASASREDALDALAWSSRVLVEAALNGRSSLGQNGDRHAGSREALPGAGRKSRTR